ncbi:MAG: ribonuclease HII [Candidatus Woesearchaeota archaeon]
MVFCSPIGPLIGPMVMVGVLIDDVDEILLKDAGVKDSKLLSQSQRERLYETVKALAKDFKIIKVQAKEIDDVLEGTKSNLNWLEADKTIEILAYLKPETAYIDCPSTNVKAYKDYLNNGLAKKAKEIEVDNGKNNNSEKIKNAEIAKSLTNMNLVVEHKADEIYPVASAASIIAKVVREHEVAKIKVEINDAVKKQASKNSSGKNAVSKLPDFGSGYPSDPRTQAFAETYWDKFPEIFRKSWSSYKNIVERKKQRSLGDF